MTNNSEAALRERQDQIRDAIENTRDGDKRRQLEREFNNNQQELRNKFNYSYAEEPNQNYNVSRGWSRRKSFGARQSEANTAEKYRNEQAQRDAADAAINAGTATAGDILGRGSVQLTSENIARLRERAEVAENNRQFQNQRRQQLETDASNLRIVEEQKAAGLNNAEIVNYNVTGQLPAEEQDPSINPVTGRPYSTMEPYNPTTAQRFYSWTTKMQESDINDPLSIPKGILGAAASAPVGLLVAYKDAAVGIKDTILHPVRTTKNTVSFLFDTTAQAELGAQIGDKIRTDPGFAIGYTVGFVTAPRAVAKAGQASIGLMQGAGKAAQGIARSKQAAVFRGGRRVSPMSNVQKSKVARQQYYNPKQSTQPGMTIQKMGRANTGRMVAQSTGRGEYKVTVTNKSPRTDGLRQTVSDSVNVKNTPQGYRLTSNAREITLAGKGSAARKSQASTKVRERAYARDETGRELFVGSRGQSQQVIQIVQQQSRKMKRTPNPKQTPELVNPANVDPVQARLLQKNAPSAGPISDTAPMSKREARFKNKLEVLGKQARAKQRRVKESARPEFDTQTEVGSLFDDATPESRAIVPVQNFKGQIQKVSKPRNLLAPTANSLKGGRKMIIDETGQVYLEGPAQPAVQIIPPLRKGIRVESVARAPKEKTSLRPAIAAATRAGQLGRTDTRSILATGSKSVQAQRQRPGQRTAAAQRQSMKQQQAQALMPALGQVTGQSTRGRTRTPRPTPGTPTARSPPPGESQRIFTPQPPRPPPRRAPPRRTTTRLPPAPRLPKNPEPTKQRELGFDVLSRKQGKIFKINKVPLSKADAEGLGQYVAGNTARAAYKVVAAGAPVAGESKLRGRLGDFVKGRGGFWVERRERRIKSAGEKQEIRFKGRRFFGLFGGKA